MLRSKSMLKEYSEYEWIQIGIFLVGLPIAAVLGALVGLVGRWMQGRVLVEANRFLTYASG
jgi:hypothetical protein